MPDRPIRHGPILPAAVLTRAGDWHGPLLMMVSPSDRTVDPAATRFFYAATNAASARRSEQHSAGHILPLGYSHEKVAE